MADVKISQLPAGTANANAVVPATNAAGTTTQKITLGAIANLYTLPVATASVLGGVKDGTGVTIGVDGTISADLTATGITAIVALTQAEYDALSPPSATTLYVIT